MESYSLVPSVVEPIEPPSIDLSGLLVEGVTEVDWLNSILSNSKGQQSLAVLDVELSRVLGLLETTLHDTSSLVDRTIEEISRSIPRLSFDLQLMRENALLLKLTLEGIKKRSQTDQNIGIVMEKLKELDLIKFRMESARDVLREAESWSTLESEVITLITESAYTKAAERLQEAARSMIVFQNTTEYEARRALMISLQNQLEAALSTSLVTVINQRDVKSCKSYYSIFTQIQRESEFTAYYFGSRRATLTANWTRANLNDTQESYEGTDSPIKFTSFLSKFYSDLHSLLNEERNIIPAIFPNPTATLSAFLQTTLEGLTPSLPQRLSAIVSKYGAGALPEIIIAYKATEEFSLVVEKIMGLLGSELVELPTSKQEKRLSKRMSLKRSSRSVSVSSIHSVTSIGGNEVGLRNWETVIFEPFLDWQVDYPTLERQYIYAEMKKLIGSASFLSAEKGSKLFGEQVGLGMNLVEESLNRCLQLSHGYATAEILPILDEFLYNFLLRRKEELDLVKVSGLNIFNQNSEEGDELELEGLEYSAQDWTTFQLGLKLLQTCRIVSEKLSSLEGRIGTRLQSLAGAINAAKQDSSYTIPGTTRGAIILLQQSTLNSMALANLLDSLDLLPLFLPRTKSALTEFTRSTQLFLHSTILAPLYTNLSNYASLSTWSSLPSATTGKGAFDLSIPTFSLSPTETISKVGEGLFSLPRLFEVYAEKSVLGFSLETLPFLDLNSLRESLITPISPKLVHSPVSGNRKNSISSPSTVKPIEEPLQNLPLETLISLYLSSLTLSLLSHLTKSILPTIMKLTKLGAEQLSSDLSYITNVARALDVESSEELDYWKAAIEKDPSRMMERKEGKEKEIWDRVLRISR